MSDVSRHSTITTTLLADIIDPDDTGRSIDGFDMQEIIANAVEDFADDNGYTVGDVRLVDEDDIRTDYILYIFGSVLGVVLLVVAAILIIGIILIAVL